MRIAVTGAGGFIGGWLMPELARAGHQVSGADVQEMPAIKWIRDPRTYDGGPYQLYEFNLLEPGAIARWLDMCKPDLVVHLAAQVGRIFGEYDVHRTVRLNAEATAVLAQACGDAGVRMAYASTSEIYGDHGTAGYDENAAWLMPRNLYGLTKRWGEEVCRMYAPDGLVIFRPSMPYGPGAPPGHGRRAMDTMLWQAYHRKPIMAHRGAERSWCWVGDTVRGIRLAIEQPDAGVFNIGRDDDPRSMLEIAQLACKLAGAPDTLIEEVDPPDKQIVVKRLRTDRLRALEWAPTVDLADGMAQVYHWVTGFDANGARR